jgi:hypothetical protein
MQKSQDPLKFLGCARGGRQLHVPLQKERRLLHAFPDIGEVDSGELGQHNVRAAVVIIHAKLPLQLDCESGKPFGTHHLAGRFQAQDCVHCTNGVAGSQPKAELFDPSGQLGYEVLDKDLPDSFVVIQFSAQPVQHSVVEKGPYVVDGLYHR